MIVGWKWLIALANDKAADVVNGNVIVLRFDGRRIQLRHLRHDGVLSVSGSGRRRRRDVLICWTYPWMSVAGGLMRNARIDVIREDIERRRAVTVRW